MKNQVSDIQAQEHFPELLDEVTRKGRRKIITRQGKPVAFLGPLVPNRPERSRAPSKKNLTLLDVIGPWEDGEELYQSIMRARRIMRREQGRPAPNLED